MRCELVLPFVEAVNFGLNASSLQLSAWNGAETVAVCPWVLVMVLVIGSGLQLVGFKREGGPVDRDADVADVRDDPVDDRRDRFRAGRIDR